MSFLLDRAIENGVPQNQYELEQIKAEVSESESQLNAEIARLRDALKESIRTLDDIGGLSMAQRVGGPDPMDLYELDRAVGIAIEMAHDARDAAYVALNPHPENSDG